MDGGGSAGKVGGDWGEIAQNWRESQKRRNNNSNSIEDGDED